MDGKRFRPRRAGRTKAKPGRSKVLLLTAVLLIGGMGSALAGGQLFSDVGPKNVAYEAIEQLTKLGVIKGYKNGTFEPDEHITRAEAAMMLNRLRLLDEGEAPEEPQEPGIPEPEPPTEPEEPEEPATPEEPEEPAAPEEPDAPPADGVNPVADVETFKYYLDEGSDEIAANMAQMDLVIVEPVVMDQSYIDTAQAAGTLIYGYINSMEADNWNEELMAQFEEEDFYHENGERVYIEEWDAYLMDMTSTHYQDVLLAEIGKRVAERGLDGVFLDTAGNVEDYHDDNPQVQAEQMAAMGQFVKRIAETYPEIGIAQNWGFKTLEQHTGPYMDFIMWENFSAGEVQGEWYENEINRLKGVREEHGVEVFTIAFENEAESAELAASHGFKHYYNPEGSYYNHW